MRALAVIPFVVMFASSSVAQSPSPEIISQSAPKPKLDRNDPAYVICRRQQITGYLSRYQKTCKTRAQWISDARLAQEEVQNAQDRGLINSCSAADRRLCD